MNDSIFLQILSFCLLATFKVRSRFLRSSFCLTQWDFNISATFSIETTKRCIILKVLTCPRRKSANKESAKSAYLCILGFEIVQKLTE